MRPKPDDRLFVSRAVSAPTQGTTATRGAAPRATARVGDAFLDHAGGVSAMRIISVLVCLLVLGAWIVGMLAAGHYLPLGWPEVSLISSACGAKAVQSRFELGSSGVWGALPSPEIAIAPASAEPAPRDLDTGGF